MAPGGAQWWNDQAKACVERLRDERELSADYATRNLRYLRAFPASFVRAGLAAPNGPTGVTTDHIRALKQSGLWRTSTLKTMFSPLRDFLREAGNPLADPHLPIWRLPRGEEDRRNWPSREQLQDLLDLATGRLRVRVALQGFNGLREKEVRTLCRKDLDLGLPLPKMRVWGKGRYGGKPRPVAIVPTVRAILVDWVDGLGPEDRLYGIGHSVAHVELAKLGREAGLPFPLSGHVLRRGFAAMMLDAGVEPDVLKEYLGHSTVEMTLHYGGRNLRHMTAAAAIFERYMSRAPRSTVDTAANGIEES